MKTKTPLTKDILMSAQFLPWGCLGMRRRFRHLDISFHALPRYEGAYEVQIHDSSAYIEATITLPAKVTTMRQFLKTVNLLTGETVLV